MSRCTAKSKQTGQQCKRCAMENGKCYYHGGATPKKHPNHKANMSALKHGLYSKKHKAFLQHLRNDLKAMDELGKTIMQNEPIGQIIADYVKYKFST